MKRITTDASIIIEDSLPAFSLDVDEYRELEKILAKWGFKASVEGATYGDETVDGSIERVLQKFGGVTNAFPGVRYVFHGKTVLNLIVIFNNGGVWAQLGQENENQVDAIFRELYGFAAVKNKNLRMDERPGVLYLRPKASIEYLRNLRKQESPPPDPAKILRNTIESKLRKLIRRSPEDERAVQDAVEDILVVKDYEYHREVERVATGSTSSIPDFTLDALEIALEVKFCKSAPDQRRITEEINADITSYKTKYRKLVFVVYDIGIIRNIEQFGSHITANENVYLTVVKH